MADSNDVRKKPDPKPPRPRRPRTSDHRDVGPALRRVYQQTVEEAIPDEMLDLLAKLR